MGDDVIGALGPVTGWARSFQASIAVWRSLTLWNVPWPPSACSPPYSSNSTTRRHKTDPESTIRGQLQTHQGESKRHDTEVAMTTECCT